MPLEVLTDVELSSIVEIGEKTGQKLYPFKTGKTELPRVRQKFYQTDPANPGSGIGLALVDEIVRLHGGRMEMDSEPGVGTAVTVLLPVAEQE